MTDEIIIILTIVTIAMGALLFLSVCAFFTNVQKTQTKIILQIEAKRNKRKVVQESSDSTEEEAIEVG